jgi:FkbM family methyltransferase
VKGLDSPLEYRAGESDLEAFIQVLVRNEYEAIGSLDPDGVIIDCGANVGYTTAWLHRLYPRAHIIAIEPNPDSFRVLQRNVSSFSDSVTLIRGAVWSRPVGLAFERSGFRDGLSWSTRVREPKATEQAQVTGYDIPSLVSGLSEKRIALLKMDVEGAESEIFANATEWVQRCDVIAIELHDEECERVFRSAIASEDFSVFKSGELTICRRRS